MPSSQSHPANDGLMRRHLVKIVAVSLTFAATSALAQIYTWKDENGRTVMSDKPPTGKATQKRIVSPSGSSSEASAPAKTFAEKELEFRQEQQSRQDKAKKSEAAQAEQAQRQENCASAKRNLQLYQSGERIARRNDSGEREFLDDAQRAEEVAKAQRAVNDWCR